MNDDTRPQDDSAVAAELKGVPENLVEHDAAAPLSGLGGELGRLS